MPASPGPGLPGARWLRRHLRSGWCPTRGVAGRDVAGLSESCDGLGGPGAPRLGFVGHGPPASHSRRRPVESEGAPS